MANHRASVIGEAGLATQSNAGDYEGLRTLLIRLRNRVGPLQVISFGATVLFAVVCTLWAIQEGVSLPLALMGGYCTIMIGVMFCMAQLALTRLDAGSAPAEAKRKPNYAAWKLVNKLNVSNASRLWCDIEPGHPYSQESAAWAAAMLDAIKSGILPICPKPHATREMVAREQSNPGWNTEVTRESLLLWAQKHGHLPTFLRA